MEETQLCFTENPYVMSDGHMLSPPEARSRSIRSHSLKPLGQPSLLTQRSKRTLSLPSKPVLPPFINVQRYHDNWEYNSEEDEVIGDCPEKETAWYTPLVGFSCSLFIYVWSCLLAYYSQK